MESSGLVSSGSGGASITVKGESTSSSSSSSSSQVLTGGKTFAELSEEEKRRFLEIQKKDEEASKSQWGDGTYEKKVRYQNSKSESTVVTSGGGRTGGGNSEALAGGTSAATNRRPKITVGLSETGGVVLNEYSNSKSESTAVTGNGRAQGGGNLETSSGTSSVTNVVNRGPTFTVGSSETGAGAVHNEYESRGTSSSAGSTIYTGSSQDSHGRVVGGSSTASGGGGIRHDDNVRYGSPDGVYGAAHFSETAESSSAHRESSSGGGFTAAGGASQFGGGSFSGHRESSVSVEKTGTRFGVESEAARRGGSSSTNAGTSASASSAGSDSRGWSSSGNSHTAAAGEQTGWGAATGGQSYEEKWSYESRGSGGGGRTSNADRDGSAAAATGSGWQYASSAGAGGAGAGSQGRKNFTSFHESENSHVVNTTWDDRGPPKTYVKNQWRTNDDGYVRNGSSAHVEDGLLDYRDAIKKMNTAGGTNVVSNIPGDDSALSVTASTGRQDQGFRQAKVDETVSVQKWRTVDGKLYRVNNADDWNALTGRDGSTEVYEAQDYYPQDYRKHATQSGNNNNNNNNNQHAQDVDGKFKLYTRFKRDTVTKKCGPTRCATVKCKIGPLSKDQEVWLSFRSRAWVNTLKKVSTYRKTRNSM